MGRSRSGRSDRSARAAVCAAGAVVSNSNGEPPQTGCFIPETSRDMSLPRRAAPELLEEAGRSGETAKSRSAHAEVAIGRAAWSLPPDLECTVSRPGCGSRTRPVCVVSPRPIALCLLQHVGLEDLHADARRRSRPERQPRRFPCRIKRSALRRKAGGAMARVQRAGRRRPSGVHRSRFGPDILEGSEKDEK